MQKITLFIFSIILSLSLLLSGCGGDNKKAEAPQNTTQSAQASKETSKTTANAQTETIDSQKLLAQIPPYSGKPYVTVNNNKPYFKDSDYTTTAFEN